jgi:uncharacterized membrane protein
MSIRHTILDWAEQGAVRDAQAALELTGLLPGAREWRTFLDRLFVWSAAIALAAAAVFFVAYNWNELGRFARFALAQALVVAAVLAYWRFGPERRAGKAALLAAAVFLGALLALFGQVYQTGADTWELFANWAALVVPWVLVGRFAALWMLWLALLNLAAALYYQAFPDAPLWFVSGEPALWALFALNSAALVFWERAAQRVHWLAERWWPRLIAIASGAFITVLVLDAIFGAGKALQAAVLVYALWLAGMYGAYRKRLADLFMLAGACLSIIVVVAAFMWDKLFRHADSMSLLLIAVAVAAMGAVSARWLRQVAREGHA